MAHPYIIIFDDACAFCRRWVRLILWLDRHQRCYFAASDSRTGKALLKRFQLQELPQHTLIVVHHNTYYLYSEAVCQIGLQLPALRWLAFLVMLIPRPLRDRGYRVIARHRYRFFPEPSTCPLPRARFRQQFLP